MNDVLAALLSLVPPLLVGGIFWVVMRAIIKVDSKERDTYAKIEAEERTKFEETNKRSK